MLLKNKNQIHYYALELHLRTGSAGFGSISMEVNSSLHNNAGWSRTTFPSPHLPLAAGLLLGMIKNPICSRHPSDQLVGCRRIRRSQKVLFFSAGGCCGCELRGPHGGRLWKASAVLFPRKEHRSSPTLSPSQQHPVSQACQPP